MSEYANNKSDVENTHSNYLESLSVKERIGIEIAKTQLGSSFCLERSLGYIKYVESVVAKQTNEQTNEQTN
tara:strand:- start:933 stop:1145 length:213 start_codon:yes stop_codon:yes gene_type:complete